MTSSARTHFSGGVPSGPAAVILLRPFCKTRFGDLIFAGMLRRTRSHWEFGRVAKPLTAKFLPLVRTSSEIMAISSWLVLLSSLAQLAAYLIDYPASTHYALNIIFHSCPKPYGAQAAGGHVDILSSGKRHFVKWELSFVKWDYNLQNFN